MWMWKCGCPVPTEPSPTDARFGENAHGDEREGERDRNEPPVEERFKRETRREEEDATSRVFGEFQRCDGEGRRRKRRRRRRFAIRNARRGATGDGVRLGRRGRDLERGFGRETVRVG